MDRFVIELLDIYSDRIAAGDLSDDSAQRAVLARLEEVRVHLTANRPNGLGGLFKKPKAGPGGIYLWGGVGRGKSMLMDLFIDAVDIEAKRRIHFHAFMQSVHAGMNAARKRGVDDALAPVADDLINALRCLALDEMQITDITDAMLVGRLFQRLFDGGVVVVTTSNRTPDDLYKDGLNRQLFLPFIDLIKERLEVIELRSPSDYRQAQLAGEQVYFTPADANARQTIDGLWNALTNRHSEPLVLLVQGREVTIPRFHNGIARADFLDLCGRPLGPADYLALADQVKVLFLEDIPRLSRHNFNEARRFVTLVDALYEARVRLIASAAAEPDKLYVEGAGSFEFERTASRLLEMQSADWANRATSDQSV